MDINGIKNEIKLKLGFRSKQGEGGQIYIFADKIKGNGKISATGGEGLKGGKGGNIHIVSKENYFKGKMIADGGKSLKNNKK